jgi:Fic family protein
VVVIIDNLILNCRKYFMPVFRHFDLQLLNPDFTSPLVDLFSELDYLRRLELGGTTPSLIFIQLKSIFHVLESLGSARIEGNHTTLADYVESTLEGSTQSTEHMREISNLEKAMVYIDEVIKRDTPLTEHFIRELHSLTVNNLIREGDDTPGAYRSRSVVISQAEHLPPEAIQVPGYMQKLVAFINQPDAAKYDLMKIALVHHRFSWIHPFHNGNGRVVRLITYALLIKYGFNVRRILNPTAVFCNDRERYYKMLSCADKGTNENLERWCVYVLEGIATELKKIDQLTRYDYLKEKILIPALSFARARSLITEEEESILLIVVKSGVAKSSDIRLALPELNDAQRTYQIKKLVERKMLQPIYEKSRQYTVGFVNSYLIRGVSYVLSQEGFIPKVLSSGSDT